MVCMSVAYAMPAIYKLPCNSHEYVLEGNDTDTGMVQEQKTQVKVQAESNNLCAPTQRHTTLTVKDLGGGLGARDPLDLDQHPCPQKWTLT